MKPISCTICGKEHTSDNYYKVCPGCLHELNEMRHAKLTSKPGSTSFLQVSEEAFEELQNKFRMGKVNMEHQNGKRRAAKVIYEETTGDSLDETLDIVKVHKKPLTEEEYFDLEYHFLNLDVIEGFGAEDELRKLNQLMDLALQTNDIYWAKDLHKQMQRVKGECK